MENSAPSVTIGLVRRGYSASGGAEAYLKRLAAGLQQAGHHPVLLTSSEWPDADWSHGPIVRLPGNTPEIFAAAVKEARDQCQMTFSLERVPGCTVFRAGDGVHAAWLDRRAAFEPAWRDWLRRHQRKHRQILALEQAVFRPGNTSWIVANSQMVRREILEYSAFPEDRIAVIPNGLSISSEFIDKAAARTQLGWDADARIALFVGSGWERKGLRFAVEAVCGRPLQLKVAGRGKFHGNRPENVHFLGPVRSMEALYAAADVFVLPTLYDPFSNACLEAHAAGLPVITTQANGFADLLIDPVLGVALEKPDDRKSLRAALEHYAHENQRQHIRNQASVWTIERNVQATLKLLVPTSSVDAPNAF